MNVNQQDQHCQNNDSDTSKKEELRELTDIIEQDTENILSLRMQAEREASQHQRLIERLTANLGRPRTLYLILFFVSVWIIVNLVSPRLDLPAFDTPQFPLLQDLVSLSALLMTTAVLITQRRQEQLAEQRRHLDLELTLLTERKVSKLIELVEELRHDLPDVENRHDPQAEVMKENADPEDVLSSFRQMAGETTKIE